MTCACPDLVHRRHHRPGQGPRPHARRERHARRRDRCRAASSGPAAHGRRCTSPYAQAVAQGSPVTTPTGESRASSTAPRERRLYVSGSAFKVEAAGGEGRSTASSRSRTRSATSTSPRGAGWASAVARRLRSPISRSGRRQGLRGGVVHGDRRAGRSRASRRIYPYVAPTAARHVARFTRQRHGMGGPRRGAGRTRRGRARPLRCVFARRRRAPRRRRLLRRRPACAQGVELTGAGRRECVDRRSTPPRRAGWAELRIRRLDVRARRHSLPIVRPRAAPRNRRGRAARGAGPGTRGWRPAARSSPRTSSTASAYGGAARSSTRRHARPRLRRCAACIYGAF